MATELFKLVGTIAINATTAQNDINAIITAGSDLEAKLNTIGNNADNSIGKNSGFNAAAVWLGNMLTELTRKAIDLGIDFAKIGFAFNASAETYKATFQSMLGLTDKETDALYEKLRQFAVETPYSMEGIAESAIRLFNAGFDTDGVMNMLETLGNIAGGDSQKLQRLIKAFTDTKGYGVLRAQERNQFVENGVLIYDLLSDYYEYIGEGKKTADQLVNMQSNKEISYEDVWNALVLSTQEGYRYYERMDALMETWGGKTEKLRDNLDETAGAVTKPFFDVIKNETIDKLSEVLDRVQAWAEENPEVLNNLATALSALATNGLDVLLGGLEGLLTYWNDNQETFGLMIAMLGGLAIAAGHPVAGTALVATGAFDAYNQAMGQIEEGSPVGQELARDPEIAQAMENGTTGELTGMDWFNYHVGAPFVQFMNNLFPGTVISEEEMHRNLYGEQEVFGPPTPEWFSPDNVLPDGTSGDNGFLATLAAMLQPLSTLKADVAAAAQEGVTAGVSNITVTGSITTGNVTLNDGVLVGRIAPQLNLKLGMMNQRSSRG